MPNRLELGLIVALSDQIHTVMQDAADLGLTTCQLNAWDVGLYSDELADRVIQSSKATGVRVSSVWAGHSGKTVWNFLEGPRTIGLVPREPRAQRLGELKRGADFAKVIGAPSITTHVGFIHEDPNDPDYPHLIATLTELAKYCDEAGLKFCFETGQETPVTLLRTIEDIGTDNLGINLDPANLILYGKANPVDALDVFGRYVYGLHAKDGRYPTNGRELGEETALGDGKVDFPTLIGRLKSEFGYDQPITIEREISGPQQTEDIRRAIRVLDELR